MKFLITLSIFLSLSLNASAVYPVAKVKIHNGKLLSVRGLELDRTWLAFIDDYPELLKAKGKPYKVDQFCNYELELGADNIIDLNSLRLMENNKNLAYNLKTIEFLRKSNLKIKKKDTSKPIRLEMIYLAF